MHLFMYRPGRLSVVSQWMALALLFCFLTVVATAALRPSKLLEMDQAIQEAIADKQCPGGVLWLESHGQVYTRAYGSRSLVPNVEPITADTIYDAASLTKVVTTTPAIMLLIERGKIGLEDPVKKHLPEFTGGGKDAITLRHLLTHTSGLRPGIETRSGWSGQKAALERACAEIVQTEPGTALRYSDINFIVLGEVVQRVSGKPLEQFVREEIYVRLKMTDSGYLPAESLRARIAPTEEVKGVPYRGVVHDPTARAMGGVAGHAGVFFTAADLARYARMLLNGGELEGVRIFRPETVRLMVQVHTGERISSRRGLGWDIDSSYSGPRGSIFPLGSFGHTGWTGTSIWIDPFSRTFVIFLSNRNHPGEAASVGSLRNRLGTLAAEAVEDFNFACVPGALAPAADSSIPFQNRYSAQQKTLNGIDVLARSNYAPLRGLKVALITNHPGQDRDRNPTIDLLWKAPEVKLVALFSPEHGIRGEMDEKIGDSTDARTGLPIYSLYGETRKPTGKQLEGVDALVYDIQDVGCRFYTYTSTMGLALEAAAEHGKKIFVLDRVNPIDGVTLEGPVLTEPTTFVGFHPIPLRYGMTIGELAGMFNEERTNRAELTVIKLENWRRSSWFDQTGLPWTNPSPNMRNLKQAILYPGVGLLESAVSVGRGTDTPFELIGAPYIEDVKLAEALNAAGLAGVKFVPIRFTPSASVHRGTNCGGVYIMLTDREQCAPVDVGLTLARTLARMYPTNFSLDKIKHLLLHKATLEGLRSQQPLRDIKSGWRQDLEAFERRRAKYLLYN